MKQYETVFVVDSLLKSNEIDEIIKRYERFISANGGSIRDVQRWGKKRLAYEIKKRQYGYYVCIRYEGPGSVIKPLEREFTLNESILRYLNIALEPAALKMEEVKSERAAITEGEQKKYDSETEPAREKAGESAEEAEGSKGGEGSDGGERTGKTSAEEEAKGDAGDKMGDEGESTPAREKGE